MIGHTGLQLLLQTDISQGATGRKGDIIAIDAAAGSFTAITIGAGEPGIHINLADTITETPPQVMAVGVYPQIRMNMFG